MPGSMREIDPRINPLSNWNRLGGDQRMSGEGERGEPDKNYRFKDIFFPYAGGVRDLGLETLKKEHDNVITDGNPTYPGIRSKVDSGLVQYIRTELETGLELEIDMFHAYYHLVPGIHKCGLYHTDADQLSGLIYLNPKNPCPEESGTLIGRRLVNAKIGQRYKDASATSDKRIIESFNVLKTEWNAQHFETIHRIHNYYNRLVVYEGKVPHAPGTYFGKDFDDSRLALTFFFNTK